MLEILQFPARKGEEKWHRASERLFLGIDHTAIVVADTGASLGFYRDGLGLRVAGASENYGSEQEHLNNVHGARLRITALRAANGPGIELPEYLTPRDGRPLPGDQRANDLAHWQTRLRSPVVDAALTAKRARHAPLISPGMRARHAPLISPGMRARRAPLISPGLIRLPSDGLGFDDAFLVRDPDGHAMELVPQ
ncbi:MAG: VOC family protein [bacterium]